MLARAFAGEPPAPPKPPDPFGASALRATWCDDQPPALRTDPASAARFADELSARSPVFGASFANQSLPGLLDCAGCAPAHPASESVVATTGAPPPLVVSGLHDPNTPHAWAEAFVKAVGAGPLSVERPGHAQYLGQHVADGCVDRGVAEYLVSLRLPEAGTVCPLDG